MTNAAKRIQHELLQDFKRSPVAQELKPPLVFRLGYERRYETKWVLRRLRFQVRAPQLNRYFEAVVNGEYVDELTQVELDLMLVNLAEAIEAL